MNIKVEDLELLGNRILILPDPVSSLDIVSTGGLVTATGRKLESKEGINDSLGDMDPPTGRIVAIGPDVTKLKVGQRVIHSPFSGKRLKFMLDEYLLMSEPEPVMIVKE